MALSDTITWGSIVVKDADTQMRLGHRFLQSPSTVTNSTGIVTVTVEIYLWTKFRVWDSFAKLSWSGSFGSGSATGVTFDTRTNVNGGWGEDNIVKLRTLTRQVTASEATAHVSSLTAALTNVSAVPGTAYTKGSWTTAKKPQSLLPPEPITNVFVAEASSDSRSATLQWTRTAPNSSDQPYAGIFMEQWWSSNQEYVRQSDLGNTYTTTVGRMAVNALYRWRFKPFNSSGSADTWAYSPFYYTKPNPARNVRAVPQEDGSVKVTWDLPLDAPNTSYYKPAYFVVRRANGGTWLMEQGVEVTSRTWSHVSPDPTLSYEYGVFVRGRTSEEIYQDSDIAVSNKVLLSAPPLTPKVIAPLEGVDLSTQVSMEWEHVPQDGSDQQAYNFEWWLASDPTVRTANQSASSWNKVLITTPAKDDTVYWRVQTKGVHASYSPWTATQSFKVSAKPSIVLDTSPSLYWGGSHRIRARFTYTDPAGQVASSYQTRLLDAEGKELVTYTGTTSMASGTSGWSEFGYVATDNTTYTVQVRVADAAGVYSDWASASLTTAFYAPPTAEVDVEFVEDEGKAVLTITVPPQTAGTAQPDRAELLKYAGNGQWELLATFGVTEPYVYTDWNPNYGVGTHNLYVVRVRSVYPSESLTPITYLRVNPEGCDQWLWLSSWARPELRVRLRGNPAGSDTAGRTRALRHFWDEEYPVEYSGVTLSREIDLSGQLDPKASRWEDWLAVSQAEGSHIYRDPFGRNLHVSIDPVKVAFGPGTHRYEGISVKMEVVQGPLKVYETSLEAGNTLLESGQNVYRLISSVETDVAEVGVNVYALVPPETSRVSFMEVGENVYALVDWDNPMEVSLNGWGCRSV